MNVVISSDAVNQNFTLPNETEILRQTLVDATETIEYMVKTLMWSADYKVLAESKEKLWKYKQLLSSLDA